MTERTRRQVEIVDAMIEDALISAHEFERDCEAFAESQKIDEMADIIEELSEWIEERDADRLEELGISMEEPHCHHWRFRVDQREEPFVVRPRSDMTIAAGAKILAINPELPVLEEDIYAEVLERILIWAGASQSRPRKRFG